MAVDFRSQDEAMWAGQRGVAVHDGGVDYRDFVDRALVTGSTENGVFAARVMWGTLKEIVDRRRVIHQHNRAWHEWFAEAGITPHTVRHEDLDRDPIGTATAGLAYLGLEAPHAGALEVRHRRLADRLNTDWIELYSADT